MSHGKAPILTTKIRILQGVVFAFGPGKADLLEAIGRRGSVVGAGQEMGLSYSKTRRLVDEMNASFRSPLVETARGGSSHGGASVTALGREALNVFRAMERHADAAVAEDFQVFRGLLR